MLDRWLGSDGQYDRLVKMGDEQSDDDGQSDGWGKMVYRWSDVYGWSDGLVKGRVTDGCVNDKLTGCQTDWS